MPTPLRRPFLRSIRRTSLVVLSLAAISARAQIAPTAPSNPAGEEVIALSPFEVISDNKGYFSSNTMSGTRLNSKIED